WRCAEKHVTVVGSLAELSELSGSDQSGVDPHRPAIDEVSISCRECGGPSTRVSEVIDTWYDSGAMPFAQWGYHPELGRGIEMFEKRYPADFISEAIDQTRGWFYTLMAEGALHFDSTAYRNVVCLGHIVDAEGRKMSKSLGNALDPWEVLNRQGADALRWFLLTSGSPWSSRRISMDILDDVVRRFLLTLWNTYSFFVTYAEADGFDPSASPFIPVSERPLLDRWAMSQLASTVQAARDGLESYDATGAGRSIADFVDDLSNWFVRRSRRRFWDPADPGVSSDKASAYQTLYTCLTTLSQLLAPFIPFTSEAMWRNLAAGRDGAAISVHLSDYPQAQAADIDPSLDTAMAAAREIVELGRRVRAETRTKVRQPLLEAVVHYPGDHDPLRPLLPVIAEELNVREVLFAESAEQLAGWKAKPNFKVLGPRLGPKVKDLAAVLATDDGSIAASLAAGDTVTVQVSGEEVSLSGADVDLTQETKEGWGVSAASGLTVALDLELTKELRLEGLARELVRLVQDARKAAGLEVSDRISVGFEVEGELVEAIAEHSDYICGETLAVNLGGPEPAGSFGSQAQIGDYPVTLWLAKA
ncbi:MAG: DUF5915 domain-containing protein, partial [Actinobacteria bacterium]|nr:DUF5915 domain-containing protein [Actinomycetota bacterium]